MNGLRGYIERAGTIAIAGHRKPDGDCIGACMAVFHYIRNQWGDKDVTVYMGHFPESFQYISGWEDVVGECGEREVDLFIALDCGDADRLGKAKPLFEKAKETVNVDHHVTNTEFADYNHVEARAAATCEALYHLMERDGITYDVAVSLYTGIIHDTGVLKYPNTTKRTLATVGELIEMDLPFTRIIDETFYQKTYVQNQILGRCLLESVMILDGRCLFTIVSRKMLRFYDAESTDLEGIVEQLRVTKGVEVAILLFEMGKMEYKVSMRSKEVVDVSRIAGYFGGGGHLRAAGCTMGGSAFDAVNNLSKHIEMALEGKGTNGRDTEHI